MCIDKCIYTCENKCMKKGTPNLYRICIIKNKAYLDCTGTVRVSRRYFFFRYFTCKITKTSTGWRRGMECLIFIGHFPQKSSITSGSFAKNDQQFKASHGSSPSCRI